MASMYKLGVLATLLGATPPVHAGCPFLAGQQEVSHVQILIMDLLLPGVCWALNIPTKTISRVVPTERV